MFKLDYVYLVFNHVGAVVGAFKKKDNATQAIPEKLRNFPTQIAKGRWEFGSSVGGKWSVVQTIINDSNDLPFSGR